MKVDSWYYDMSETAQKTFFNFSLLVVVVLFPLRRLTLYCCEIWVHGGEKCHRSKIKVQKLLKFIEWRQEKIVFIDKTSIICNFCTRRWVLGVESIQESDVNKEKMRNFRPVKQHTILESVWKCVKTLKLLPGGRTRVTYIKCKSILRLKRVHLKARKRQSRTNTAGFLHKQTDAAISAKRTPMCLSS